MSETPINFDGFADFAHGHRAVLTRVGVRRTPAGLELHLPEGAPLFWPWAELRALRDQADRDGLVLFCKGDLVSRLFLRDAELVGHVRRSAPALGRRATKLPLGRLALWASGAVASVAAIIFVLVPLMAAQLAEILPPDGEKALGDSTLAQIREVLGEADLEVRTCQGPEGQAALAGLRDRLLPEEALPYPVDIHVFDHDLVNAFALPGGHVILFRGLIDEARNPDEVTAVLAHEIGHVVNRDPTRDALRSAGSIGVLGLLFGDFAGGTIVLFMANQLINASYSQAAETAADEYAHQVLTREGISPAALGSFFERLKEEYGDAEGLMAHLSSHPQLEKRILAAGAAVAADTQYTPSLTPEEWRGLQAICREEGTDYEPLNETDDETDSDADERVETPERDVEEATGDEATDRQQEFKHK
ncbi:M48 family metallopeptidase [Aliiroseovarius crassostreae]|uniref:M48 family metallopeptidase n=1 Tax=Aliiroseovarius crassostreae TaxID=154981 RepID=UPI0021FE3AD0|nr:M48 family metallopeptidase [Aliiroseovarius crassostreae]UWQ05121.1 M48 family metallopeptidase [Aliiroseovarius crassostreae]